MGLRHTIADENKGLSTIVILNPVLSARDAAQSGAEGRNAVE